MFVSLAVIAVQSLIAQNFTVKGTVIEAETNEPLIGVAIMQEGTNTLIPQHYYKIFFLST